MVTSRERNSGEVASAENENNRPTEPVMDGSPEITNFRPVSAVGTRPPLNFGNAVASFILFCNLANYSFAVPSRRFLF